MFILSRVLFVCRKISCRVISYIVFPRLLGRAESLACVGGRLIPVLSGFWGESGKGLDPSPIGVQPRTRRATNESDRETVPLPTISSSPTYISIHCYGGTKTFCLTPILLSLRKVQHFTVSLLSFFPSQFPTSITSSLLLPPSRTSPSLY